MQMSMTSPDLVRLGEVMREYAAVSGRTLEHVLAKKGQQVLLGAGTAPGFFSLLADTAPRKGAITAAAQARDWRTGWPTSTSLSWARERADALLGGRSSGAFRLLTGEMGGRSYVASVQVGKVGVRGRNRGQLLFGTRSRTAKQAEGVSREAARAAGGVVLNRQALVVALATQRRERSRLATAAQFLPGRYRSVLQRIAGRAYRSGQLVGVSSTDAAMQQRHELVLIKNRKARTLGEMEFTRAGDDSTLRFSGLLGLHTARQIQALNTSIRNTTADTELYLRGETEKSIRAALARKRLI